MNQTRYLMTIGLEIHVQLKTKTKIFCSCENSFTDKPNTHICPVCMGHPGTLPSLNEKAVELALRAAMGFGGEIHHTSLFDRKAYFYPDLPKGYQITQAVQPYTTGGKLEITTSQGKKTIRLDHIHMEEDAGKLVHANSNESFVDFNRSGTPLLEIVTLPDMNSPEEAEAFARQVRQTLQFLGVTDGNMQEGSLRFDVNLSIAPEGSQTLGVRTETKNLNSFQALRQAIELEYERQVAILSQGGKIEQETRLYDLQTHTSKSLRVKGEGQDGYKYFPDPDIPPLVLSPQTIESIRKALPLLPTQWADKLSPLGLKEQDIQVLLSEVEYVEKLFPILEKYEKHQVSIVNFFLSDVLGAMKERNQTIHTSRFSFDELGKIFESIESGAISIKIAKQFIGDMVEHGFTLEEMIQKTGSTQITDEKVLQDCIQEILKQNPDKVKEYQAGRDKLFGFFVGQVMAKTDGRAHPQKTNDLLIRMLSEA